MKFSAIVCEFNPFHYGHKKILSAAASKKLPVVCIMSGNFVQRGEAAIIDKWSRTEMALENGADLVIELPLPWAVSSAQRFALGSIQLLNSLGINGYLFFGSESGNIKVLSCLAEFLLSDSFSQNLQSHINTGITFAAAREQAVSCILGASYANTIHSPNNILAVEYIKAILETNSKLSPQTIRRVGAKHDENAAAGEISSASEIRSMLKNGKSIAEKVPQSTYRITEELTCKGKCPALMDSLEIAILAKLRQMSADDFSRLPDISEGLEYRLFNASRTSCSLNEFIDTVKTKRYTHARIRRLVLSAFLNIDSSVPDNPQYIRILGMTSAGGKLLHTLKNTLPIIIRKSSVDRLKPVPLSLFNLEAAADDLYALAVPNPSPCNLDYSTGLIKK